MEGNLTGSENIEGVGLKRKENIKIYKKLLL